MTGLAIIGYGMWTAAGNDGPASVAAMQAGIAGSKELQLWDRTAGVLMNGFQLSAHQWWAGESFLPEMVIEVLRQCHAQTAKLDFDPQKIPVLICVAPPRRPGRSDALEQRLSTALEDRLGTPLPVGSGVHPGGRTGIATLLRNAQSQMDSHPVQILIGVESFLRQVIIDHYIDQGRILCGANSSGFLPGEAVAGLIVARGDMVTSPALRIIGIGEGQEPDAPGDQPAVTGLTNAMRSALKAARTEMFDIGTFLSDLNGEHRKFKELSVATIRIDRLPPEDKTRRPQGYINHWNVVETIGEVGAALIPAAMGWAFDAGGFGSLPMDKMMFVAGEDDGSRIAIVGEFTR
jgi:3-oxoacyl-[acyl-carrier-protein] synthase I